MLTLYSALDTMNVTTQPKRLTMKVTLYKTLLTDRKTMVVMSIGKCGHKGYREVQVTYRMGHYQYAITEGYTYLTSGSFDGSKGLKSVLNILEGKAKAL